MRQRLLTAWRYRSAATRLGWPLQVGFAANNTCNTFCQMCNIWRMKPKESLSLAELRQIFGSRLFQHCVTASITGGEPTMRTDFQELPPLLADVMPALGQVNLTSNGIATERILTSFEHFLPILARRRIGFSVNLSMDGVGAVHNEVRNNPKAWNNLESTIDGLIAMRRTMPFNLVLACTFTHSNVADAEHVLEYAKSRGVYVIFRRAFTIDRIGSRSEYERFAPTPDQQAALESFFRKVVSEYDRSHARSLYYRMLLRMMGGEERSISCLYRKAGLFIDHRGDMFVCTVFSKKLGNALTEDPEKLYFESRGYREDLACGDCKGCSHDVTLYTPFADQVVDRIKSAITRVRR